MLYQVVQIKGGKETVKMVDTRPVCNRRIEELRKSYRGNKGHAIRFELREADSKDKFEAKPAPGGYQSGDYATYPVVVRKKK